MCLKATESYSHSSEGQMSEINVSTGLVPSGGWVGWGNPFHSSLLASDGCQQSLVYRYVTSSLCLCLHVAFSPLYILCLYPNFPLIIRTADIGVGHPLIEYDLILTNYFYKEPISK